MNTEIISRLRNSAFTSFRLTAILLAALISGLCSHPALAGLPDSMDLTYKASWGGIPIGTLEKKLRKQNGNNYVITGKIQASGLAAMVLRDTYDEESQFLVKDNYIYPKAYRLGPTDKPDKMRLAKFDWSSKVVKLNNDRSYKLVRGIQDAATFPLFWMINPPLDEKQGDISIVDGKRMTTFKYTVIGEQEIETPLGKAKTLLVERQKETEPEKKFRMWLDLNRSYLAVRLENVRPNNTMVFELEKIEGL